VTHFVAVDHRALVSELCGELLVGRHVMTHPREGLTRAAVEAVVASLSSEQAALPERLLRPGHQVSGDEQERRVAGSVGDVLGRGSLPAGTQAVAGLLVGGYGYRVRR
jgi:hypothetical protein